MKTLFYHLAFIGFLLLFAGCEGETPLLKISEEEKNWIPYSINQEIQFQNDKNEIVTIRANIVNSIISRSGKTLSSAYNQEQIALFLYTLPPHRNSLSFALRPSNIFIGASIEASGHNAEAVINKELSGYKVENDKYDSYRYLPEITLNGVKYKKVFHRQNYLDLSGNEYFPEYYYAKEQGLIAFKLNNHADWFYLKP